MNCLVRDCKVCGKEFFVWDSTEWIYRYVDNNKNNTLACSYTCWRKEQSKKRSKRSVV